MLSASEAAAELKASDAYVRRLLLTRRLYGIKVGPVWAILPEDLERFKSMRRGPGRPRGSGGTTTRRRRRRRAGGTRADEAVKLVKSNPGITASGIAKEMKIKPNYLYRVLGDLQKEGRVKKRGREYHPAG